VSDFDKYYNGSIRSVVESSPVFGPLRYGSAGNFDLDWADPAFVNDGKFKNFPITQTTDASYWCDPLLELSGETLYDTCVESFALRAHRVGITLMQPKPIEHLQRISRRPYYHLGTENCAARIEQLRTNQRFVDDVGTLKDLWNIVSGRVHAFGHDCLSGKWSNGSFETSDQSKLTVALGNDKALNIGMWYTASDEHPCIKCHAHYCECTANCSEAQRWYEEYPNDKSKTGAIYSRATGNSLDTFVAEGCNWPKSGTFDWSATANQDPLFYAHHWYTFSENDAGYSLLMRKTNMSIVELAEDEQLTQHERLGNGLFDTTYFKNLVPYRRDATEGGVHTWKEILEYQTSYTDFVFERRVTRV
jgi:hypothetical protein